MFRHSIAVVIMVVGWAVSAEASIPRERVVERLSDMCAQPVLDTCRASRDLSQYIKSVELATIVRDEICREPRHPTIRLALVATTCQGFGVMVYVRTILGPARRTMLVEVSPHVSSSDLRRVMEAASQFRLNLIGSAE